MADTIFTYNGRIPVLNGRIPYFNKLDPDAKAFLTAAGITDQTITEAIDTFVVGLKANSLWTQMLAIYPLVGGTATTHKFNLINPADTDAAYRLTFSGGMTHSSTGIYFGGVNGYADTKLSYETIDNSYRDDQHLSVYVRTDSASGNKREMGMALSASGAGGQLYVKTNFGTNAAYIRLSDVDANPVAQNNNDARGFYVGTRTGSTTKKMFKNGSQLGSTMTTASSNQAYSFNVYLGGLNNSGSLVGPTDRECCFFSLGLGLDDTESTTFTTLVNNLQTSLSRNVY